MFVLLSGRTFVGFDSVIFDGKMRWRLRSRKVQFQGFVPLLLLERGAALYSAKREFGSTCLRGQCTRVLFSWLDDGACKRDARRGMLMYTYE